MSHVVSTTTGYRNLQSYSHVYQPVTTVGTSTDSISYDPAQYRRIILLDMDETERDNLWIREEIRRVLVQNELLRHRFRYSQVDEERKRAYEIERRRREEEERRRWEEELARRRLEDEERRRMEDELRRRQDEDRRRLDEDRRRLEAERRRLEDEERAKLMELQHKPVAMGRFPDPGDIVQVSVMRGEELRQMGRYAPIYVKVGFDGQPSLPYRTKSAFNSGEPVWEETLPDMYMPLGARHLAVEVYEDEAKDHLIGTGKLDLRYDENTIHHVDVVNRSGERQGKVFLRYNSRHPPPPPPPPVPLPSVSQGEMGPLMDIEIVEASNLVDLDIIGKSDPYVQLCWGNDTKPFYTTKVSKGKNPVWKEAVRGVRIPAGVQYITINVWDEDPGKDDFMGTHRLLLSPPPDGDMWLPLHARENEPKDAKLAKKGNLGVINLRVKCRQGRLDSAYVPPPSPSPTPSKAGVATLDLEVIEGRDLVDLDIIGKSDPYVQFCWGTDPKPFYTTKVSKGKNPVWREGVKGLRIPDGTQFISLLVWDEDPGKDDFMGVHRLRLVPPPNGDMWLKLYPRENEPQDAKLVKKGNLGEINIRVKCTGVRRGSGPLPMPEPLSLTGPVPTRCRVTLIGAEGLAPADSNGLSDPYATISVGYEIASKEHKTSAKKKTLNPIWNETFDLHVPENETHLTFNVWDDDKLSKDDFLGQAGLDVRGPMRQNGAFFLPLRPRANNADDQKLVSEHGGLGKIRFKTEWVGLPTTVPASPTFQTASSQTSVPPSPAHQPAPIPRPPSEVVAPPPAPKPAPPPAPKPAPPPPPKPVEPPAQTFEEVSVW